MDRPAPRSLKISINASKCVGSTMCIQFAPKVFGLGPRKQAAVIDPTGHGALQIREAAEQCPLSAIELFDAETGERVFP